jgi:hypothetical protein
MRRRHLFAVLESSAGANAHRIGAEIRQPDVVAEDDEDVRPPLCRGRWCQARRRHGGGNCEQYSTAQQHLAATSRCLARGPFITDQFPTHGSALSSEHWGDSVPRGDIADWRRPASEAGSSGCRCDESWLTKFYGETIESY